MKKLGHILRVEIKPSEEGSGIYGVCIEAREHDAEIGYGYPRGKRMWFSFDDPRLPIMFNAIQKPIFTEHHDLIGVEVEMTYDEDVGVLSDLAVTGGKRRYLESDGERDSRERRESMAKPGEDGERGRRFYGCRAANDLRGVIEALPDNDQRKNELLNLTNILLRMLLIENDGRVSEQKVGAF